MNITIRNMVKSDIENFYNEFKTQGWDKPVSIFELYYNEQKNNKRKIYVAESGGNVLGYATLLPNDVNGPFKSMNIPTICDFNTLIKYQGNGVGTAILDAIENDVKAYSNTICLGVGLHHGYGTAQKMYVKRGYVPDGSGVWYENQILEQNVSCINNDDLVLYLSKKLN